MSCGATPQKLNYNLLYKILFSSLYREHSYVIDSLLDQTQNQSGFTDCAHFILYEPMYHIIWQF